MAALSVDVAQAINEFWFKKANPDVFGKMRMEWFQKDTDFDEAIRTQFGHVVEDITAHRTVCPDLANHEGVLAFIVACDQFSRNLFRGSPRAFALDSLALELARTFIKAPSFAALHPIEKVFVFITFEHSESLDDQETSVELFRSILDVITEDTFEYVKRHQEIIQRFGRFPHRNAVLGRESTPEELAFLTEPRSSF